MTQNKKATGGRKPAKSAARVKDLPMKKGRAGKVRGGGIVHKVDALKITQKTIVDS